MLDKHIDNKLKSTVLGKFKTVLSFTYIHEKFLWGVLKKIDEKFLKFALVGVLNTFVSYLLYAFFLLIGCVPNVALFFQYIFGVLWNFKTTGIIVFKNHNNKLLFKFILSYIFTFIINSIFLNILAIQMGINKYLSQAILIFPIAIISFLILKLWVFKENTK